NRIVEYLKQQGYRDAAAPHTREQSAGELLLTFTIARGRQYRVDHVVLANALSIPLAELQPNLRLRDGQPFSEAALHNDLSAIEDLYHRRGFAAASAAATPRMSAGADPGSPVLVRVEIDVREGLRTLV